MATVVFGAVLLAGCGSGSETETTAERPDRPEKLQSFAVTLDGYASPQTMGILMADKLGYFEEVGLDVEISKPLNPVRPVNYVDQQIISLAVSHAPQAVLARERGVPVVAVGSLISQPTTAMIWLRKSGIGGLADLKGKTIAIPGLSFQRDLLQSVLKGVGLTLADVKVERVDDELMSALVSGRADAIFGGYWNIEGIELETRGLEPVITRVEDLGVPAYEELVLITHRERLADDPESIRDFMSALARGTAAALEGDPKDTAEAVVEISENPNKKAAKLGVEATLPLLSRTGYMNPRQADRLIEWMGEEGFTEKTVPVSTLFNNNYLSPQP